MPKYASMPEPPDGSKFIAEFGDGQYTAVWRNDLEASLCDRFSRFPKERWFAGDAWNTTPPVTWEEISWRALSIYSVSDEPIAAEG